MTKLDKLPLRSMTVFIMFMQICPLHFKDALMKWEFWPEDGGKVKVMGSPQ